MSSLRERPIIPVAVRIVLFLFVSSLSCRAQQGACEQLGVDCHIERHRDSDNCNEECRAERHRDAQKEDRERAEHNREVDERNREARWQQKAYEFGHQAYELQQKDTPPRHEECRKAIDLYLKSLDTVDGVWQYYTNAAVCADTIGKDPSTSQKDQWKYDQMAWAIMEEALKLGSLPPATRDEVKWSMRGIQWRHGRRCPEPPAFNGTHDGCVGNPDMPHNSYPYVPLPIIDGKNWTLRNIQMSEGGHFTITTTDGHVWHEGDNFVNTPMMNARFQTDAHATVRLTLPDGHDFVISSDSDITLDSFMYDPNENLTTVDVRSLKGLCRFVTATLRKAFPQAIKLRLGPVDAIGIRGTDVELISPSIESPDLFIYVNDGSATFTDKSGKITEIPKGFKLQITLGRDGDALGPLIALYPWEHAVSSYTDHWDMTPFKGRELQ